MTELIRRFKAKPRLTTELLLASFFASILALAMPIFVIQVLNRYVAHGIDATLITLTIGALLATGLEFGFRQIRLRMARGISQDADKELAEKAYRSVLHAKAAAIDVLPVGTRQHVLNGLNNIQSAFNAINISALLDVPFAILFLFVLFLLSPILGIVATLFALLALGASAATLISLRPLTRDSMKESVRTSPHISTATREIDTVRAFNAVPLLWSGWSEGNAKLDGLKRLIASRHGLIQSLIHSTVATTSIAIIALGALLVVTGDLNVGALIGANILAARALQPITRFAQLAETFTTAQESVDDLEKLTSLPMEATAGSAKQNYTGELEFRDITFAYTGAKVPLFESLSFRVQPGSTAVVVGANGAGKTTLARLLVGVINPLRGEVLADGINLRQVAPEWWRKQLIFLPQEPVLFSASIVENISVNQPGMDEMAIHSLIDQVGLRKFIDESTEGLQTMVTDNGRTLATGIRRRIALARALATDGQLVIIDEPSEGLDRDGIEMLGGVIQRLNQQGKTLIVCAHDANAIKGADLLIDLNTKPVPRVTQPPRPISNSAVGGN